MPLENALRRPAFAIPLLALAAACQYEPRTPVVHYELSAETRSVDEQTGQPTVPLAVQDQIAGSLEMLFGTPAHPRYLRTADWIGEGYDPNYPQYPVEDPGGGGEISDGLAAQIQGDNGWRFQRQLAAIDAGRYEDVEVVDSMPDLAEEWVLRLKDTPPEKRTGEFQAEARKLFTDWYPSLRDSAELYRQQCLHCHGSSGGGDGPTSRFLEPRPRDYRKGIFKFTALKDKARPRREDLFRILDEGVTGTAMPSFRRFSKAELHGLVDYVRLLGMRGMVESDLVVTYQNEGALSVDYIQESYQRTWKRWTGQADKLIATDVPVPPATPQSVARGRELFLDAKTGNCASCHGEAGLGNGPSAFTIDPESQQRVSAYKDDWGRPIVPRNLTYGVFRGGRRPIDIYRRIYAGINGTPMPALGGVLPPEDIWALVHYVGTLSEGAHPTRFTSAAPATAGGAASGAGHEAGPGAGSGH
jgi:mono/diheme cytochrome c family protein